MGGLKGIDLFRKVPADLTNATFLGACLSIAATVFMAFLFAIELWAFVVQSVETGVVLDTNPDQLLRINFNVTMLDLPCEYAAVDVVDVIGTNQMNVTKNVQKWSTDASGARLAYRGRNREQKELKHQEHAETIEDMHADGVHAVELSDKSIKDFVGKDFAFVNFYAPWCVWCQRLAPTWERLAEEVGKFEAETDKHVALNVSVGKVDCPGNPDVCNAHQIRAFPSMRLFKKGEPLGDYRDDRTVEALLKWLKTKVNFDEQMKGWAVDHGAPGAPGAALDLDDHPGCMLSGFVLVNRVPGNFHVEARSAHHEINAALANVSHVVNHLSFGPPVPSNLRRKLGKRYPDFFPGAQALDGGAFIDGGAHEAVHHYIKVVSTHFDVGTFLSGLTSKLSRGAPPPERTVVGYQMVTQSQTMHYHELDVPEAKFSYDLSPMAVAVSSTGKHWYDFVTSCCAIIGGTFTTVGLLDGILHKVLKAGKQL
mmetsp:Transcript_2092/g.6207  ORF Transcript_2092/g.6207 Transcript_2092/m.6207 type:complete len:481 (+) Transcript_2092:175-1617(+)